MIHIIGIFITFFLALIIFTKKGRNLADSILGIWMIIIGIHLLSYYTFITKTIFDYPFLLGFNIPIPFLHGPILYLYTLALTNPKKLNTKKWLLHSLLPILIIILNTPLWILSGKQKIELFHTNGKGFEGYLLDTNILMDISGVFYVIITSLLLQKHKKRILNQFSNQEKINLNWLRFLFYAMGLMWFLIIWIRNDELIFSATSVLVVLIGYFGIKQVGIFTNLSPENFEDELHNKHLFENISQELTVKKRKYAKSGLNEDTTKDLHQRLAVLMQKEKLFIEPELTLTDLATQLAIHPNYLSQVINEIEGVNFYDYINNLRVEEFKRLVALPENQKYTLLALAFDCGFNSKSVFNRFFKKVTNLSPSEYVKQMKG